ncbi:MAG: lipopolysaccharide heptosyltransferase I [Pseudomonadales bacterium]|nr:lipopolysaccharide heptosyltransferase I [Pseudomonadales bacterium]
MTHALLVKMSSLGDIAHALPAVTDAARSGVRFDWVVEEAYAPFVARHPAVRAVLPIAERRWRRHVGASLAEMRRFRQRLTAQRYDVVLDSQGLYKSALVARLARGDRRVGFGRDSAREPLATLLYDGCCSVDRNRHAIDRQRALFAQVFGYAVPEGLSYGLPAMPATADRVCVFVHGTTWASKRYPLAFWRELAVLARSDDFRVVVTWGTDEERAVAEDLRKQGVEVWPHMGLAELIERLAGASLVIGVDTGLTHVAAALEVPVVALFGSTDAALTGVRGHRAVTLAARKDCAPCLQQVCRFAAVPGTDVQPACYGTLAPPRVWSAAQHLLGPE